MRKRIAVTYLISIHILLAIVLLKSDFIDRVERKLGVAFIASPEITEHFHRMLRYHRRMDGNVPDRAVIFIGEKNKGSSLRLTHEQSIPSYFNIYSDFLSLFLNF